MYKIIGGDGREYGPVTAEQMQQWIAEGRVDARTKAQAAGGTDWKPLSEFPEFAAALGTSAAPPPLSAPPVTTAPLSPQAAAAIPAYLVQSILCTLFCCLPLGIVAIVYAAQVNTKKAVGDIAGAMAASKNAKLWCWISFGLGLFATLLSIGVMLVGFLARGHGHGLGQGFQ